jgi:hypothetical protein
MQNLACHTFFFFFFPVVGNMHDCIIDACPLLTGASLHKLSALIQLFGASHIQVNVAGT